MPLHFVCDKSHNANLCFDSVATLLLALHCAPSDNLKSVEAYPVEIRLADTTHSNQLGALKMTDPGE
jgi:hypothetical protein